MAEQNEVGLLPCPFCACRSAGVQYEKEYDKDDLCRKFYRIQCNGCCTSTDWYSTKEEARAAWNRRAETAEWTSEVPAKDAEYWITFCGSVAKANIMRYHNKSDMRVIVVLYAPLSSWDMPLDAFAAKFPDTLWNLITPPSLPVKEGM